MSEPSDEIRRLRERLDEAAAREGEFRLRSAQDLLAAEKRLAEQVKVVADRDATIHRLHQEAAGRDGYIHQLHLGQIELREAIQALHGDLETFAWMLAESQGRLAPPAASPDLPGVPFVYHLHTSPFRIFRGGRFLLRGWAFPSDGRAVTAVRVRLNDASFEGRHGLPEPDVVARHGPLPANPLPGFEIEFTTAPGSHRLRLEARLEDRVWVSILNVPIWCRASLSG
jgi:hypothetical protein